MFTQCSNCETVFKLSADVLRAAGGQVRCGNCGEVFNALARLAENANAFTPRETTHELEKRADSILREPSPPHPKPEPESSEDFGPPGVEIARLQILDWNASDAQEPAQDLSPTRDETASDDPSMEFTLPPGELDRIFVESKKKQAINLAAPLIVAPSPIPKPEEPQEFEVDIDPVPIRVKPLVAPPAPAPQQAQTPAPIKPAVVKAPTPATAPAAVPPPAKPAPVAAKAAKPAPPAAPAPQKPRMTVAAPTPPPQAEPDELPPHPEAIAAATTSSFDVPDAVRFEILSGMESAQPLHELSQATPIPGLWRWLAAAIVCALLLMFQMVHHNREYLAAHGPFAGMLRALYAGAGAPVASSANLSAYQLRQWGVSGDPAADGTLRMRASILNGAAQLESFPLLRVTLQNRFGTSIGTRDFEPSEYLGKPTARYMNPGEQADATLDILDPGKSAEGFELDVCLRGADRKISCANDAAPAQTKR